MNGMSSGIYFYIGGYHHVVTDNDIVIIEERAVHVHDHLVPEIDVFPILASEVYVDVNMLADTVVAFCYGQSFPLFRAMSRRKAPHPYIFDIQFSCVQFISL